MKPIGRRRFMELAMSGALGAFLAACAGGERTPSATPVPEATRVRGKLVSNQNRPERNVRYYRPFVPPTPETWRLKVDGLVAAPLSLRVGDVQQLPALEQVSRMKCVECWSFKARWGGFALASIMQQAEPKPEARYVRLSCADDYWEVLPVEDLLRPRVLFAYRMDGDLLADEYGSPLRLVVPWKYGYKGAKCITAMTFVSTLDAGYWSTVGPYTVAGDIEQGYDHPQDSKDRVRIDVAGAELTY